LFLYLLVGTLGPRGGDSGGREMELMFSVILPGMVLAVAVVVFIFAKSQVARVSALVIVAGPGLLLSAARIRSAYIDHLVAENSSGRGYFSGTANRELASAIVANDLARVQRTAPKVDVNASGKDGMTMLQLAVEHQFDSESQNQNNASELPIVRELIARGAKPNPGMETATKIKDPEILRVLLEAGGDPNLTVAGSPLPFAWLNVLPAANLRLLLEHGGNPNAIDGGGSPLIVSAAVQQNWDCVAVLMEHGADVGAKDKQGATLQSFLTNLETTRKSSGEGIPAGMIRVRTLLNSSKKN
jgi:ankyrin repeat protein